MVYQNRDNSIASHHVSSKHPNSACLSLTVQCSEMWCSLKCNTHVLWWGEVHHLRHNFPKCTSWVTRWINKIKMSCLDFPLSSPFGVSVSKFQNWVVRTVIRWVGGFAPSCRFAEAAGESANVGAAGPPGEVSSEVGEERILQVLWMVLNLCLTGAGTVTWQGAPTSTSFWIAQFQAPVLTPSVARVGVFLHGKGLWNGPLHGGFVYPCHSKSTQSTLLPATQRSSWSESFVYYQRNTAILILPWMHGFKKQRELRHIKLLTRVFWNKETTPIPKRSKEAPFNSSNLISLTTSLCLAGKQESWADPRTANWLGKVNPSFLNPPLSRISWEKLKPKCFSMVFACIDLPAKLGCKIAHLSEAAYRSIFSACSFWGVQRPRWLALLKPAAYKEGLTVKEEARGAKVMETFPNMCWQNQFYDFRQHCSTIPSPSSPSAAQPPCPWRLRR